MKIVINTSKKTNWLKVLIGSVIGIPFGWFLGQLIAKGIIEVLIVIGLEDNLFRFLESVSLF